MSVSRIEQYEGSTMPGWVKEGETVAVISDAYGYEQGVSFETVTKATATQVTVGHSKYNLKKNLRRMGDSGAWVRVPYLADPDSLEVRYAAALKRQKNLSYVVLKASEAFYKDPTEANAARVEACVADWRTAGKVVEALAMSSSAEA